MEYQGGNLRRLMEEKGYTQGALAEKIDCTPKTLRSWLKGENPPDIYHLLKLADLFHVSTDYILDRSEFRSPENDFIGEYTGLSDQAVKVLHFLSEGSQISHTNNLDILNYILEEQFDTEAPADRQRKLEEDMEKVKPGLSKSYHGAKSPLLVNVHNILYQIRECLILKNPGAWEGNITKQLPNGETITSTDHSLHFSLFDLSKKITDLNEKDDFLRWMEEKEDRL